MFRHGRVLDGDESKQWILQHLKTVKYVTLAWVAKISELPRSPVYLVCTYEVSSCFMHLPVLMPGGL